MLLKLISYYFILAGLSDKLVLHTCACAKQSEAHVHTHIHTAHTHTHTQLLSDTRVNPDILLLFSRWAICVNNIS